MKSKGYKKLIFIGKAEADLITQRLSQAKIKYEIHTSGEADVMPSQGFRGGNFPVEVRVPEEDFERAQKLINLEKPAISGIYTKPNVLLKIFAVVMFLLIFSAVVVVILSFVLD